MVTLSEPISSRNDERFFKNSLFIPKIEDERIRQELTDALQYCRILMLQNGLNTAEAGSEISIHSKEIGKQMFFCLMVLIKEILLKDEKEVSDPTKRKVVDSSHPKFTKEKMTLNNVVQPDVKKVVTEEREIEEILISSSEDECEILPSVVENEHTERKFQQDSEQSQLNGSTEFVMNNSPTKKSKKKKVKAVDSEIKQFKEYQIDSWVYQQIKILRKKSAPINAKTVKQLAVKASAIYSFPEFKPTKKWFTRFTEMYSVTFEKKKKVLKPLKRQISSPKESINLPYGIFCMNPSALVDFTPIQVDLSTIQRKPVKAKNSSGKQLHKKPNGKNKRKKIAKKNLLKQLQMNAWVFDQLKIMKKNSIPFDKQTVDELALKAGNIFLQSKFKPSKVWTQRFWKVYGKRLERLDKEVSNPTEIIQEEVTKSPMANKPIKQDTAMSHDMPLSMEKKGGREYEIKREKNQSSVFVQEDTSYDYIPLSMKKENPKPDVTHFVSSEEIFILSSDDECLTNLSSTADRKPIKIESFS